MAFFTSDTTSIFTTSTALDNTSVDARMNARLHAQSTDACATLTAGASMPADAVTDTRMSAYTDAKLPSRTSATMNTGLSTDMSPNTAMPVVAYVLLWFPLASETFIFREITRLMARGLPIHIYTLYGKAFKGCSAEMLTFTGPLRRMGLRAFFPVWNAFFKELWRRPRFVFTLLREGFFRRMRNVESLAENLWSFMAGFLLAHYCHHDGISLIHAAWANGPGTAGWVASRLTGIPFAFSGHAGDIYPEDGLLHEKARDACFIRVNNRANLYELQKFCPPSQTGKVHLIYNCLTFSKREEAKPTGNKPYRLLAVGRFARTKGFPELLAAVALLKQDQIPVHLTLIGDGVWRRKLTALRARLRLTDMVDMPGFVPHDQLKQFMCNHDLLVVPSVVHSNGDRDGIPNVIMEALSHCMPVVATDVCGIAEVVRDGETGFLVPERDPAALAGAVRRILENYGNALRMAKAGRALVEKMFDENITITALRNLYLTHCPRSTQTLPSPDGNTNA